MMKTTTNGNCLLIYGGGLCDSANFMMRTWADALVATGKFGKVFVGFNSFAATQNPALIEEWTPELKAEAEKNFGGFFGTSRNVEMTNPDIHKTAIELLKSKDIEFVGCIGGDGSSRCLAEIAENFLAEGILWAFLMPATIAGIEGGRSFGLKAAVRTSCYITEQLVSTCLNTLNATEQPVLVVELQGRNRDDILANVLAQLDADNMKFDRVNPRVVAVPANYPTSIQGLVDLRQSEEPILILLSEGAAFSRSDIKSFLYGKKVRTFEVAHLSQMNGMTSQTEKQEIGQAVAMAERKLPSLIDLKMPFAFVYDSDSVILTDINYYAQKNPRAGQKPTLNEQLDQLVKRYLV